MLKVISKYKYFIIAIIFYSISPIFVKYKILGFPFEDIMLLIFLLLIVIDCTLGIIRYKAEDFITGDIIAFEPMEKFEYIDENNYYNFYISIRFYANDEEIILNRKFYSFSGPKIGGQVRLRINKVDIRLSEIDKNYKYISYVVTLLLIAFILSIIFRNQI